MKNLRKSNPSARKKKSTPAAAKKKKPVAKKAAGKKAAAPRKKPVRKAARPAEVPIGPPENPEAHALARKIARLIADKKATDVVVLDVRGIASYADYVVIASGESERQVTAMADTVQQKLKEEDGLYAVGSEGQETGQWVLIDYGDVVAHLFYSEVRSHYDLEGLWADAAKETVA